MKVIKADLSRDLKRIRILPLSDLHVGDSLCDEKLLNERLKFIKENKDVYCVLNGDLINNATRKSISDSYSEVYTPMEQLELAVKLFEPIKDKILAITQGNHEFRTYKTEGIDIVKLIAYQLGLEDKYAPEGAFLFVRFGQRINGAKETKGTGKIRKMCYTIYLTHGAGGGRKEGAKAIRLADLSAIVDADIYIHSHTHLPMIFKENYFRVDYPNSFIAETEKLFVNTGACLKYGGYGQTKGYKPSSTSNPIIYLNGTRKEFTAQV